MTNDISCKVLVVGGGPGGYVAALRAAQHGLDVVLVEAAELGGTCLNRGCIPSKALLNAAARFSEMLECAGAPVMGMRCEAPTLDMPELMLWKSGIVAKLNKGVESLLSARGVRVIRGWATFSNAKTCRVKMTDEEISITAENVVLATGSVAASLPGIDISGNILTSSEALELADVPPSLLVIGGGYIGLELSTVFSRIGSRVSIIEAAERILPQFSSNLSKPVMDWFEVQGVPIELQCRVEEISQSAEGCEVSVRAANGEVTVHKADKVLIAAGRRPNTDGWGLENMGLDFSGPFLAVNQQCETPMKGVWAIGDLVGEPMLAHKATAQGEMVADIIAGQRRKFDPIAIPSVCFTEPEIVSVGLSLADAESEGLEIVTGRFSFAANGRSLSMGKSPGFVEVLARKSDEVIVGVHAVGSHISELAGEFALAIEMQARLGDISATIHAHPTLGESFLEASLQGLGIPLHSV